MFRRFKDKRSLYNCSLCPVTQICQSLGWKGKGGRFDVLPLVLQANGGPPEYFDIPENLALQVNIKHPK